ncbi:hypothetical protein MASR2M74_27010 [Paracoccaceae bacterium]
MGREVTGEIRFAGAAGPGKLLLEPGTLILRGAVRAQIARETIRGFSVAGETLRIDTDAGPVEADIGAQVAAVWVRALAKAPPTLAEKLGIGPDRAVLRLGAVTDAALLAALAHAGDGSPSLALTEVESPAALADALATMAAHPGLPLWTVTPKGAGSPLPEAVLRAQMRRAGWRDTKSCAVSPRMTACRWHPPEIALPGT